MGETALPQTSTRFSGATQPRISLVDRDFAGIRRALLNFIRVRFPDEWKDFETSGVGMAILDIVAYSHAQLSFYIDAHANEFFIPTSRTFSGMRRLTAALNYRMRLATAAGVAVTLFPQPPQAGKIRVSAGTTFRAKNGTVWEILQDTIVPENASIYPEADNPNADPVLAAEGEPKESSFISDGTAFQQFILPDEAIVEGSVEVTVAGKKWLETDSLVFSEGYGFAVDRVFSDGSAGFTYTLTRLYPRPDNFLVTVGSDSQSAVVWEQVDDFLASGPDDSHYTLTIDSNTGKAHVTFGDGNKGRIPDADELIVFTYNIIGPQERYQLILEPDGLLSVRMGDGNGAVIPPEGEEIIVAYKVGGGLIGNIGIGGIDTTIQGVLVGTGEAVAVRVQNQEAGAGAEAAETIDHARLYAPKVAASTGRASTQSDYDGLINTFTHPDFGAVAFGKADLHSDFPEANQVDISLWTRDSNGRIFPAPEAFREAVKVYLDSRSDLCHLIRHKGGDTIYVDIFADVAIKSSLEVSKIMATVRSSLLNYFLSTQVLPGEDVHFSQLVTIIQSIPGVEYVDITRVRLSRRRRFVYALGDGIKQRYRSAEFYGYDDDLGSPVIPGTFQIILNDETITDDGSGNLVGEIDDNLANNAVIYDDEQQERYDTVSAGPRFFTPYFAYKVYQLSEVAQQSFSNVVLPDSDISTILGTLVVTDGIQYAYDDGVNKFEGDVSAPGGSIVNDGTGSAEISFDFSSAANGPVYAYYLAAVPEAEFDGNPPAPMALQQQISSLLPPVRSDTLVVRHDQDLVVDDGEGSLVYGQNITDTRPEANTVIYKDVAVTNEDISIWQVALTGGLRYQGRLQQVPQIPVLSPQLRPGHVIFTDGFDTIQDDGETNLSGGLLDGSGANRIFYEDTDVEEIIAVSGQDTYTGAEILPNVKRPPVHGAAAPYFQITTEVQDPGNNVFYAVVLQDNGGSGVLSEASGGGPNAPYMLSGTVNYATNRVSIQLKYPTTRDLEAEYTVLGGTFDFLLNTAFQASARALYRKALGGQLDVTFPGTNAGQPLQLRYAQALGGHFDVAFADVPGLGDLIQFDYRYLYELAQADEELLAVTVTDTRRVRGRLTFRPVKRGTLRIRAIDLSGAEVAVHDDGGGVFVGSKLATSSVNYIDYETGVFEFNLAVDLLVGSQVLASYDAFSEPEDVVPVLDDQMADVGQLELRHIDPVDVK